MNASTQREIERLAKRYRARQERAIRKYHETGVQRYNASSARCGKVAEELEAALTSANEAEHVTENRALAQEWASTVLDLYNLPFERGKALTQCLQQKLIKSVREILQ